MSQFLSPCLLLCLDFEPPTLRLKLYEFPPSPTVIMSLINVYRINDFPYLILKTFLDCILMHTYLKIYRQKSQPTNLRVKELKVF